MPMVLGGSGTINTSSSLAVAIAGTEDISVDSGGNTRFIGAKTFFKTTGNPSSGSKIYLAGSDTGDQWIGAGQNTGYWMEYSGNANEGHVFRTGTVERVVISGSNSTAKVPANCISLNPNGGYVLTPSQPMCYAVKDNNQSWVNYGGGSTFLFNNAYINNGNNYNASTGTFTCPVAGFYKVSVTALMGYNGGSAYFYLRKNGSNYATPLHCNTNGTGLWPQSAATWLISCAVNDALTIFATSTNATIYDGNHNSFLVELVG